MKSLVGRGVISLVGVGKTLLCLFVRLAFLPSFFPSIRPSFRLSISIHTGGERHIGNTIQPRLELVSDAGILDDF